MEVHFTRETEKKLHDLVTQSGRAADQLIEDAIQLALFPQTALGAGKPTASTKVDSFEPVVRAYGWGHEFELFPALDGVHRRVFFSSGVRIAIPPGREL